jgi:SSS family solute:Na+ symporter
VLELKKAGLEGFLFTVADINFLHFAGVLFLICSAVLVAVSLVTRPPTDEKVAGLTFATTTGELGPRTRGRTIDVALSAVLVLCVFAVWWYFSS